MPILDALIQKCATEIRESFVQYEATAAAGKDNAGCKALLYSLATKIRDFGSGRNGERSQRWY
jgi:hypothetical protein